MKRLVIIALLIVSALWPLLAYNELRTELFWRSASGQLTSSKSVTNTYAGTELDVRLTSSSSWDGAIALTLFGGAQKALSLTFDGQVQDVGNEKVAWYYGAGSAVLFDLSPVFLGEFSLSYETAWTFLDRAELSLDTLRLGLRLLSFTSEGFLFSLGFEYSRPLWGRLIDRRGSEAKIEKYIYKATGLAVSVGVGFQAW